MYHSRKALPWQQRTLAVVVGSGHARASGLARIAGDGHGQHAAAIHLHQVAILPCGHHQVIQITRCLRERGPHDAALAAGPGKLAVNRRFPQHKIDQHLWVFQRNSRVLEDHREIPQPRHALARLVESSFPQNRVAQFITLCSASTLAEKLTIF
jgi:hypothetical protein